MCSHRKSVFHTEEVCIVMELRQLINGLVTSVVVGQGDRLIKCNQEPCRWAEVTL